MNINEWAVKNALLQCMGCKGYDKSELMIWRRSKNYGAILPYCTEDCYRSE